jgi:hypothetical protein
MNTSSYNEDEIATVIASNCTAKKPRPKLINALTIAKHQAIVDMGATSIFIMEGAAIDNKHIAVSPLIINLPDGKRIQSTHVCDINILGLPTTLTGHIVPSLTIASLIGIRSLCKAGCKVTFDNTKCDVIFKGKVILRGFKDPSTDLWMLPIPNGTVGTTPGEHLLPRSGPGEDRAPHLPTVTPDYHPGINLATFMHSVRTQANAVKFAHQSLCNPKISTLLKATRKGFLKGCPNMTKKLITK